MIHVQSRANDHIIFQNMHNIGGHQIQYAAEIF